MNFKDKQNKKGFTLLEILVAIALFAAIIAMLYPTYIGTFRNMDITESYSTIYRSARIAMERISEDLQCAGLPGTDEGADSDLTLSQVFSGKDSAINGKNADDLEFMSEKHISFNDGSKGGRGLIKYYIKEYEEKEGFILYRSDRLELGNKSGDDSEGLMLCEDVNSINFSFQDENGDTYDYWDSSSAPFKGKLPSMVSVELEFMNKSDPESPIKFITSIAIPMAKRRYGSNS
jgi:prepilin-type N-terminal cleavage/methylation domain-containing protein